jgi:hypothetical protein
MKYWEIVADKLSKAGWSWGCVSAIDSKGRTIWIADAHRDDGKRFVVRADEKLTAFMELEAAVSLNPRRLAPQDHAYRQAKQTKKPAVVESSMPFHAPGFNHKAGVTTAG